jgi:hypothetical protein
MSEQTTEERVKYKLVMGYTKHPKMLLSLEVWEIFQTVDTEGYVFAMKKFTKKVKTIVGDNLGPLCDKIADEILRHMEKRDGTDSDDNAS